MYLPVKGTKNYLFAYFIKYIYTVLVAQWIARRTSNPEVAGSSPAENEFLDLLFHASICNHLLCRVMNL